MEYYFISKYAFNNCLYNKHVNFRCKKIFSNFELKQTINIQILDIFVILYGLNVGRCFKVYIYCINFLLYSIFSLSKLIKK